MLSENLAAELDFSEKNHILIRPADDCGTWRQSSKAEFVDPERSTTNTGRGGGEGDKKVEVLQSQSQEGGLNATNSSLW